MFNKVLKFISSAPPSLIQLSIFASTILHPQPNCKYVICKKALCFLLIPDTYIFSISHPFIFNFLHPVTNTHSFHKLIFQTRLLHNAHPVFLSYITYHPFR